MLEEILKPNTFSIKKNIIFRNKFNPPPKLQDFYTEKYKALLNKVKET